MCLGQWRNIADIAQAVATISAILVGGFWAWRKFFKEREESPKIRLSHSIYESSINKQKRLVRLGLKIDNQGKTLLTLTEVATWLKQVDPWPREILKTPLASNQEQYEWPGLIGGEERKIDVKDVEIEPNECEEFFIDFVISSRVQTIIAYSFVNNPTHEKSGIGWNIETTHNLGMREGSQ